MKYHVILMTLWIKFIFHILETSFLSKFWLAFFVWRIYSFKIDMGVNNQAPLAILVLYAIFFVCPPVIWELSRLLKTLLTSVDSTNIVKFFVVDLWMIFKILKQCEFFSTILADEFFFILVKYHMSFHTEFGFKQTPTIKMGAFKTIHWRCFVHDDFCMLRNVYLSYIYVNFRSICYDT